MYNILQIVEAVVLPENGQIGKMEAPSIQPKYIQIQHCR